MDLEQYTNYLDIITQPIDFGTIKSQLANEMYKTAKQFLDDAELVFKNAYKYNEGNDEWVIIWEGGGGG